MNRWIGMMMTLLTGMVLWTGCANQPPPNPCESFMVDPPATEGFEMNSVNIIDRSLFSKSVWVTYCHGQRVEAPPDAPFPEPVARYKISVEQHASTKSATGTTEVWTLMKNHTEYPLQVEGRTQFFTKERMPAGPPTEWQRVHLMPKSLGTYRTQSTQTRGVEYYYIELREGR